MLGISSLFAKNIPRFDQIAPIKNVLFKYQYAGKGETCSFFLIDGELYFEDYKGWGREKCEHNIDITHFSGGVNITLDDVLILMHTDNNPGHTLANLLWALYLYEIHDLNCKVVIPKTIISISKHFLEIILLYVKYDNLVIVDSGDIVFGKTVHIYNGSWHLNYKYNVDEIPCVGKSFFELSPSSTFSIAEEIKLFQKKLDLIEYSIKNLPTKVIAIKTQNSISSNKSREFDVDYENFFNRKGFYILKPENTDLITYFKTLNNADEIITSWGAISYIGKLGFSKKSNVVMLCHEGYKPEYQKSDWQIKNCYLPDCQSIKYFFDLSTEFILDPRLLHNS